MFVAITGTISIICIILWNIILFILGLIFSPLGLFLIGGLLVVGFVASILDKRE